MSNQTFPKLSNLTWQDKPAKLNGSIRHIYICTLIIQIYTFFLQLNYSK